MRILFLTPWFPYPRDNGSKLRVYYLLRALAEQHHVTLISFAFGTAQPEQPGDLPSLCKTIRVVPDDPFAANRAGTLRTFLSPRPMASRPIPAMSRLVGETLASESFDVVISATAMMAEYALRTPRSTARILDSHSSMTGWLRERYRQQTQPAQRARCWASWQKQRRSDRACFGRFDLVTTVSNADRATAVEALATARTRVEALPNGVDCERNRPGLAPKRPRALIYNGSLTYSANYDAMRYFLADIYPTVRRFARGATLTITGSTSGVDLAGLTTDDSVRLTGYVEDVRVPVAEASACVVPLRQGGGTRLKILEAMALGTPVVATSKGAEGLDLTPGEHLLLADDPETFARCAAGLLCDSELSGRLATAARHLVEERYDWREIGASFVDLVNETAAEGKRRHG
ncbi:MAG: glycosyltransferase family 4 protein [Anaerolineae bacterium]|jgi:glycosyltransferase involved in cell wall biosynthesis|nr:glycosyltransferase family 4 protein [Anaerolineae bacterium]